MILWMSAHDQLDAGGAQRRTLRRIEIKNNEICTIDAISSGLAHGLHCTVGGGRRVTAPSEIETRGQVRDMRRTNFKLWLTGLLGSVWLSGCVSGPPADFERPELPVKSSWSENLGEEYEIEFEWWRRFNDPRLAELIERAVENNADLSVLAARSDVARGYIDQAQSSLLPTIAAGTSTQRLTAGESPEVDFSKVNLGSEMSWEIDVWGKARRGIAAQEAAYQSSLADWRAGYLTLVSDVAIAYLQLRLIDEQRARQRSAIGRSEEILAIYEEMFANGLTSGTNIDTQQAQLSEQRAGLIELEGSRKLIENGLATLLGQSAGTLQLPDTSGFADIQPVDVPAGLPSEILTRRPDILAAEYDLLRACNLEAQARLARLPAIGLTGVGGTAAYDLEDMFRTITGGVSSFIRFPVFDPAVRARIRVSEAEIVVAEEEYRATVIRALEEVENALANISMRKEQVEEREVQLQRLRQVETDTHAQLELGMLSYLDVLVRQRDLLDAEQQYLINRWQVLIDTVTLFKAVGGGWSPEIVGA